MWRIYNPELDPSIAVDMTKLPVAFSIKTAEGHIYDNLDVLWPVKA